MEGRGRSRARKKRFFSPKRLTSFLLAAAMVFTNVGADLSTAFAADSTDVSFEMRGADLVAAIEDAVASENVVAPDDLNFTNGNVEKFEDFLFGDGKLYEAYPEMDGGDVETELRVFVRLPESADDMYAVTGDEEVIFLYVNNSDETVRFRSYISYTKDGEEEIKRTDSVTVRSYESAYGDEEVNVISDPVEVPETEESTGAPETAAPEEETPAEETAGEEDPVATESEMKVSFSRNEAALAAAPAGDDPKATPSEMEDSKDPEESNEGLVDEGNMPNEKDPADVPGESAPAEESTPVEESAPADETTVTGEPQVPETTAPETTPAATPSETVPEKKPDAPKPSYSDLVGIGWSGTAKMYTSTLNKLHAFEDVDGWQIQYSIDPEGSARIVDGPRGVEDGEDLYFGVKNQLGYAVETVLANGEELAADTITDNEDGSQTAWYTVYGVTEEQDIDVVMAETGEHPGFSQEIQMDDGMVITIQADEGVLPDGVTATAERAGEDVENAVAEQATEDGKAITSVKAYDISLWLDGQLLDSAIWGGSRKVEVTFSGAAVEEQSAQANTLEIVHVETAQAAQPRMRLMTAAAPAASVTGIDQVKAVEVPEGQTVSAISFEAEHFSIYAVVGGMKYEDRYTMQVGETITLKADDVYAFDGGYWKSSKPSVVEIISQEGSLWDPHAVVTAKKASSESVWITYHYGLLDWQQQTFKISVKQADTAEAYFYILRPDGDAGSLEDEDWLYVGTGKIKTDNLINQYGGPLQANKGQYDLAVEGKVSSYPDDQHIKEQIARLYHEDIGDVEISYKPFKISYPMGYVDENGNSHLGNTSCYHVDMTVSITTKEQASVTFHLQDAGKNGYEPVESPYTVDLGTEVEPRGKYPAIKLVGGIEYEFNGWYTNSDLTGEPVEFPYTVTKAVDFYAKYEPKKMVTIFYQAVGGEKVEVTKGQETFAADAEKDAAKGSQAVKTDGYVFKGWYDNDEGTGNPLATGYNTFKPEKPEKGWENAVYYAVFEKIKESEIDGPYVEIDDVDNDKEYYQGSVNVEVYLDGEKVEENSETIHYGYEQYNCVDLELTYPENEKVVLNAIYAKQSYGEDGYEEITSELVDNVENGSTVYIYLSSVYTVEYTAENAENVEQDNKKYTLPNSENHWDYNSFKEDLTAYGTRAIHVKDLPKNSRYTYEGWFAQDATEVEPGINWRLKEAIEKADANNVVYLHATSKQAEYNLTVEHVYKHADGTKDTIVPDDLSGVYPAGTTITVEARDTEGYRFDGFLVQTDVTTTEYGDAYRTLMFKTYPSDMYVQVLYVEEPTETYELHVEHVYKHADGTKDTIVPDDLSGVYPAGTTITVEARDTEGYRFDGFLVQTDAATTEYGNAYRTLTFKTYPSDMIVQVLYVEEPAETYELHVEHVYKHADGTKDRIEKDEALSGVYPAGTTITVEARDTEGYRFDGFLVQTDAATTEYGDAYRTLTFKTYPSDMYVQVLYVEEPTETYELHVEHVYKHADGTKDRIEKDEALSGVYPAGTTITVEARDTEGYRFDGFLVQTDAATTEYGNAYRTLTFKTYPSAMYVQVLYVEEPVETYTYNLEVVHVYLNEDGTTKEVVLDENQSGEKELGELIKAEKTEREGYEFTGRISYEVSESDYYKEYTDKTALSFRMPDKDVKVSFYYELAEAETQTQTYTIHHLEEGTDKVLAEDVVETAAVGSVIDGKDKQLSINGYAFVSATTLEVKADSEQNHVYVYYGKDSIGPDGDNDPDGEPDAYQIVFTFRSSDEAKGTLSGTTRQVYTFKDNDGNYVKPAEGISQRAVQQYLEGTMEGFEAVTITSKEGYEFDYWTVENQEVAPDYTSTMDELGNTPFTQDTTFVVYFSSVGGSSENPGGDSGSGGNSGGGGGGSSSGPSGSGGSSTAGPGVTITDGDVPLAPLPSDGSGSSAVIYDDNVPLAPLPKTGQESLKAPLTALFAGIFLALASLKRRKEEN